MSTYLKFKIEPLFLSLMNAKYEKHPLSHLERRNLGVIESVNEYAKQD